MTDDANPWWRTIDAEETAFFLDVDGTLLGFKDRPEDVVADAELLDLLRRLERLAEGAIAFVSGRTVSDLDRIMKPLVFPAAGVHGADLRFADGRRTLFKGAALTGIRAAAQAFVASHPSLRIEDKGGTTFAIHYRQAPELAERVAAFLRDTMQSEDFMVQHGKMVVEVKPRGCHKGLAIDALMETLPFLGRRPLFVGDDLTDEYGFATVRRRHGFAVKVGTAAEETVAQYRIADVPGVRDFLTTICRLGEGR